MEKNIIEYYKQTLENILKESSNFDISEKKIFEESFKEISCIRSELEKSKEDIIRKKLKDLYSKIIITVIKNREMLEPEKIEKIKRLLNTMWESEDFHFSEEKIDVVISEIDSKDFDIYILAKDDFDFSNPKKLEKLEKKINILYFLMTYFVYDFLIIEKSSFLIKSSDLFEENVKSKLLSKDNNQIKVIKRLNILDEKFKNYKNYTKTRIESKNKNDFVPSSGPNKHKKSHKNKNIFLNNNNNNNNNNKNDNINNNDEEDKENSIQSKLNKKPQLIKIKQNEEDIEYIEDIEDTFHSDISLKDFRDYCDKFDDIEKYKEKYCSEPNNIEYKINKEKITEILNIKRYPPTEKKKKKCWICRSENHLQLVCPDLRPEIKAKIIIKRKKFNK
jgi:hypothetical protein